MRERLDDLSNALVDYNLDMLIFLVLYIDNEIVIIDPLANTMSADIWG